jgi:hypothetical protein
MAVTWSLGLLTAVGITIWVVCALWSGSVPPLKLRITFAEEAKGVTQPIIVGGKFEAADFLTVQYAGNGMGVIYYDFWGHGGPGSTPFALQPGTPHDFEVTMPALADTFYPIAGDRRLLRVVIDGHEILQDWVQFHRRARSELYFGTNPIGGSPAPAFSGQILTTTGRSLRGPVHSAYSSTERLEWLLYHHGWHLLIAVVAGILAGCVIGWFVRGFAWPAAVWLGNRERRQHTWRNHAAFTITGLACALVFLNVETGGTYRLVYPVSFGDFFDYQAASLWHGRLDVPRPAISGEAFIVHGKSYGYFGITPAVLRMPLVLADIAFGEFSRGFMLAYFILSMIAAYCIFRHAVRLVCGPTATPSPWATTILTIMAGAGSSLFYLASRAYTYHEAILCGAMFALWSAYFTLRYVEEPGRPWWLGAIGCGLFSLHARPTPGLFALVLLGCAAAYHVIGAARNHPGAVPWRHAGIGALSVAAVLSFNGMSFLKFGTFDGAPLRYSVQYNSERLARIGGKNFHLANLRHDVDAYVLYPNFHFERRFPYFYFDLRHPRSYPEAMMDSTESTVALPVAMPALFALTILSVGYVFAARSRLRVPVTLLWIGVVPMALALFTAVATAHRYTADFCPFLICCAACTLASFDQGRFRKFLLGGTTLLSVASVLVVLALTLQFQGERVWGAAPEAVQRFQELRRQFDGVFGTASP